MADPQRSCSVDGCEGQHRARGFCVTHYTQRRASGDLDIVRPRRTSAEDRFWANVDRDGDGCWNWTGTISNQGYGTYGRHAYAHRHALELATGQDLTGLEVDHICHNRACVNPAHLRSATHKQNQENLVGANSNSQSGVRGVWYSPLFEKWVVQVGHRGRRYSGGHHATKAEAEKAAVALRNRLFTHNDADRAVA
jgi:hypothetical protein